jgi:hypothetical protein
VAILTVGLSFIGPVLFGWFFAQRIWPDIPRGLRLGLSASLGCGMSGTVYFLGLLLNSSSLAFAISECALAAAIVMLLINRTPSTKISPEMPRSPVNAPAWTFFVCAVLAAAAFFFALDSLRYGAWDAFVMWNLRARFISTSQTSPFSALLDPVFLGLHPDYPLLLPAMVSRGWQYTGGSSPLIPMALATLFTAATILTTVAGLQVVCTKSQSWMAGCILVGTPFLIGLGAWQYADIIICCFMTTAIVLYAIYDLEPSHSRLPLLAGIAAAAAACTKNEGILFLVVLVASRVVAIWLGKSPRGAGELLVFAIGAAFGVLTLTLFKLTYSPVSDTLHWTTAHAMFATITNGTLHLDVIRGIRQNLNFGQWRLNPVPLMALHAAAAWQPSQPSAKARPSFTPAFALIGMSCGYYLVYLLSPYDVEAHVQSSLDRLLIQLWPMAIVLYSVIAAPRDSEQRSPVSAGSAALRVAAVLVVIGMMMVVWPPGAKPEHISAGSKPHAEVNRAEVRAGETYRLKISGIGDPEVYISYSLDGKPMGQFGAYLGTDGAVDFQVSQSTPKGTYRFLAVRTANNPAWISFDNDAVLAVK